MDVSDLTGNVTLRRIDGDMPVVRLVTGEHKMVDSSLHHDDLVVDNDRGPISESGVLWKMFGKNGARESDFNVHKRDGKPVGITGNHLDLTGLFRLPFESPGVQ